MHLATGSLKVKIGDRVQRGQHIAGVGGTGELPWVHLHFQVTDAYDRADPLAITISHSLPVRFTDVVASKGENQPPEPGMFVEVRR